MSKLIVNFLLNIQQSVHFHSPQHKRFLSLFQSHLCVGRSELYLAGVDNIPRAGPPCVERALVKYVSRDYDSFDNTSKRLMSLFYLSPNICYKDLDKTSPE